MVHTVERLIWRKGLGPKQVPPSAALQRQMQLAALRLAVAVNELISNAVKHAFSGRTSGRIMVGLIGRAADGGSPLISVVDDGCGFTNMRPGNAGLTFVKHLVNQAGGVLDREDGEGTRWDIRLVSNAPARP